MQDSEKSINRSALSFFSGTMLSRFSGLFRDMALAYFLGSGSEIAAFLAAFRFAYLFRRLFGDGCMDAVFVPHFEEARRKNPKDALHFFRDFFFSFLLGLVLLVILMKTCMGYLQVYFDLGTFKQIAYFVSLMLPGLVFICLYVINSSLLQCFGKFFFPAFAPLFFNITLVGFLWVLKDYTLPVAVKNLCYVVALGYFFQFLLTFLYGYKHIKEHMTLKEFFKPKLFSSSIFKLMGSFSLTMIGVGAIQFNSFLDVIFARIADASGPAYLWYSIRLQQLPLALFGIAISRALLPPLSRAAQSGDFAKYKQFINISLSQATALMVAATFGILFLGAPAINLIYGRGGFTEVDTWQTTLCLICYGIGLLPTVYVLLLSSGYYAKKSFVTPTLGAVYSVAINLGLNALFVFLFSGKSASIALATSIASFCNFIYLAGKLSKDFPGVFEPVWGKTLQKTTLGCLGAGCITFFVGILLKDPLVMFIFGKNVLFSRHFMHQVLHFSLMSITFFASLLAMSLLLRDEYLLKFVKIKLKAKEVLQKSEID